MRHPPLSPTPPFLTNTPPTPTQGKTIDDIINDWSAELENRSRLFVKQSQRLAHWDREVLRNRHTLLELEEALRKVSLGQESLDMKLSLLETHQKEVHDALLAMEGEADKMFRVCEGESCLFVYLFVFWGGNV